MRFLAVLAIALAVAVSADARITSKSELDSNLPKIEEEKAAVLDLDEDDYSGDDYYYDDEDEDYDEEYYGSGDDKVLEETEKELDVIIDDIKTTNEFHFEEEAVEDKDSDLLFEYYNEIYEEDYEEGISDVENPIRTPTEPEKPKPEGGFNYTNILMMVASGVVSFAIFTLAFVLCCYRRGQGKRKNLSPVRMAKKPVNPVVRPSIISSSPIVKDYLKIPQDVEEMVQSSTQTGMENSSHILNEKNEPLLP